MPELPEVQTIVNDLKGKIIGAVVKDFATDHAKAVKMPLDVFIRSIKEKKIIDVERRGKYILIGLGGGKVIIIHLKMTGSLLVSNSVNTNIKWPSDGFYFAMGDKFVHHGWLLKKNGKPIYLRFSDVRKFATIGLLDPKRDKARAAVDKLGIEPLSQDFSFDMFRRLIASKRNMPVRKLMLDQSAIAGLGNIYVAEILHEAKINPQTRCGDLHDQELKRIHKAIRKILNKAIKLRGTTISDYKDSAGKKGGFQNALKVYGREGGKCKTPRCRGIIKRETVGQRSSFYCPACQK